MRIKRRDNVPNRVKRPIRRGRLLPYLMLAMLMTLLARVPHQSHWRLADYLDTLALDGCFSARGPLPADYIAQTLTPTKDFYLVELPYNTPWSVIAKLIRKCSRAKVVAIDMMLVDKRAELTPAELPFFKDELPLWRSESAELAQAMRESQNVAIGVWPEMKSFPVPGSPGRTQRRRVWQKPAPEIWNAARYHAHLLVEPAPEDGITRRVPLFQNTQTAPGGPVERLPSLSLAVAGAVKGVRPPQFQSLKIQNGVLQLNRFKVPMTADGMMPIDYLGPRASFENMQIRWLYRVILGSGNYVDGDEEFANKIVFLGRTDYKAKDDFTTPFDDMPGLHVHMHAVATLLGPNGPPLPLPLWKSTLIALAASILLLFPLLRLSLWGSLLSAAILCVLVFLGCFKLFVSAHQFFPVSVPLLAIALTYNGVALYEYGRARTALARFLGRDVAGLVLNPLRDPHMGGQSEVATAFFCDLRGFSTAAERLSPEATETFVNNYTEAVTTITSRFGGRTIDYFGDGVFVLFRQPGAAQAVQAARAALCVQEETRELIEACGQQCKVPLKIAIGINTGTMIIGVLGSHDHMKLGAVGDAVNVAARIQALTGRCGYSILITKECYNLANGQIPFTLCGQFEVKGREQTVEVYGTGPLIAPVSPQ